MEEGAEEIYVEVDLDGIVEKEWITKIGDTCKFVALDSDTPYLQLGPYTFQGQFKDAIGSSVFFDEYEDADGETKLKMKCHTFKKLEMKRCFLKKRPSHSASGSVVTVQEKENTETSKTLGTEGKAVDSILEAATPGENESETGAGALTVQPEGSGTCMDDIASETAGFIESNSHLGSSTTETSKLL